MKGTGTRGRPGPDAPIDSSRRRRSSFHPGTRGTSSFWTIPDRFLPASFSDTHLGTTHQYFRARQACELTGWEDFTGLDALAAAYAEVGNFEDAIRCQQLAMEKAAPTASPSRLESFRRRLGSYRAKQPHREETGET